MAIQHTTASPYGTSDVASYSFNSQFAIDLTRKRIYILVLRYENAAAAAAGKQPLESIPYTIQGAAFDSYVAANLGVYQSLASAIETYILTRPEYEGGSVVD